jgi:hypothetical protein
VLLARPSVAAVAAVVVGGGGAVVVVVVVVAEAAHWFGKAEREQRKDGDEEAVGLGESRGRKRES